MHWSDLKRRVEALQASGKLPQDFELIQRNINRECGEVTSVTIGEVKSVDDEVFDYLTKKEFEDLDPDEQAQYEELDEPVLILDE